MPLVFEDKIPINKSAFTDKVNDIANYLGTNPNYLMAAMNAETAGTFSPSIQNTKFPLSNGYATGLIQFTPDTAAALGTSTEELKGMSNLKQLDYVKKYFEPYKGKLNSYFDVYLCIFFPAAIGKPDEWIFETKKIKRSAVAKQNPGIDLNKDGKITVAEFKGYLMRTIPSTLHSLIFDIKKIITDNKGITAIITLGLLLYFLKQK